MRIGFTKLKVSRRAPSLSVIKFSCSVLVFLAGINGGRQARAADSDGQITVLRTLQDFERSKAGPYTTYRQLPESELRIIAVPEPGVLDGGQSLRVRVPPTLKPGDRPEYPLATFDTIYLPPEADAVRATVRATLGSFTLTLGGPTVYFGNSDVYLEPQAIPGDGKTYVVEWSLHHRSSRNFRRLNPSLLYGREMAFFHYPRWIQEPMRLCMLPPPAGDPGGELVIDLVELISRGQGRPFPVIPMADCTERGRIEFNHDIRSAFTFTLAGGRDIRKPMTLSHDTLPSGDKALGIRGRFVEETSVVGIRVGEPPGPPTNALAIDLKAVHEKRSDLVIDLLIVVAEKGLSFPPGVEGFDHDFSNPAMAGKDYAVYHARRPVDPTAAGVLVPFADFACFFGQGTFRQAMIDNAPIDPARVIAVGVLVPYGFNSGVSTLTIERLRWLSVPGAADALRSYRQPTGKVSFTRLSEGPYGGTIRQDESDTGPSVKPAIAP